MAPSLFLLYSSSSIKFYDHLQGVTAHQWFWNYGCQENLDSKLLDSYIFSKISSTNTKITYPYDEYMENLRQKQMKCIDSMDTVDSLKLLHILDPFHHLKFFVIKNILIKVFLKNFQH